MIVSNGWTLANSPMAHLLVILRSLLYAMFVSSRSKRHGPVILVNGVPRGAKGDHTAIDAVAASNLIANMFVEHLRQKKRYNCQQVQKCTNIKRLDTHAHAHAHVHVHTRKRTHTHAHALTISDSVSAVLMIRTLRFNDSLKYGTNPA